MKNYKNIEDLLDRFFNGYTSCEEEELLYSFFAGKEIPEHLAKYKPVFGYFETELEKELAEPVSARKLRKPNWIIWGGIAASLMLFILSGLYLYEKSRPFNPYEGSYIVRNGVRITDPDIIRPELEAIVERIMREQEEAAQFFLCLTEKEAQYDRINQQLKEEYDVFLNKFKDPYARRMVQTIMETE